MIEYGHCQCGCGEKTPRATRTQYGNKKGQPIKFLKGHGNRIPVETRFWRNVAVGSGGGCWMWTGAASSSGYGYISSNEKQLRVHRFAYEMLAGSIRPGLELDHLCREKLCVNPLHLEPVTTRE